MAIKRKRLEPWLKHTARCLDRWENLKLPTRARAAARKRVLACEGELRNLAFNSRDTAVQRAVRELIGRIERMRQQVG